MWTGLGALRHIRTEKRTVLVIQNPIAPAGIRHALVDLAGKDTTELRIASAYVTHSGSNLLLQAITKSLGQDAFAAIPKVLVTSFDFGLTEPNALSSWLRLKNVSVLIVGADMLEAGYLTPTQAFHPKMYAFGKMNTEFNLLVGSANLTGRGLTINSEAAWSQQGVPYTEIDEAFTRVCHRAVMLTDGLLSSYRSLRQKRPAPAEIRREVEQVEVPAPILRASYFTGLGETLVDWLDLSDFPDLLCVSKLAITKL